MKNLRITFYNHKSQIRYLLVILFCFSVLTGIKAQNAIVGSGFTTGWGSGCTSPNGTDYTYLNASAGTTYTSGDLIPKGTGNQYWRLAIGWGGTFYQVGGGSDIAVIPGTKYSANIVCAENGAWYRNVSALTNRYIFKTLNAGVSPTGNWVFFELSGGSATVSSVSQSPATVYTVDPVVVTATLSGSFPTGQGAYLRYSTDNFSTSTVVPMTGSGTSYKATIPAQVASTTVKYYVFTSGSGLNIASSDADLYTINWNAGSLNGGSNYSYTVTTDPTHSFIAKYLFDFGPVSTDVTNGDITTNPDANGNYWNNITSDKAGNTVFTNPLLFSNLKNSGNGSTTYGFTFNSTNWTSNGKMNGGLKTPYGSQLADPDLAISTATEDYVFNTQTTIGTAPTFQMTGLNNAKRYRFKLFASRNTNAIRTSSYNITGITSLGGSASTVSGTLNACTTTGNSPTYTTSTYNADNTQSYKLYNDGGSYTVGANLYYGNNSLIYTSGYFYPSSGIISMAVYSPTGGYAYINCMKMEEFKGEQTITLASTATKTIGTADYSPATASSGLTVSYSSSNTGVATIVNNQIHIVGTGTTTITASQAGDGTYEAATSVQQTLTIENKTAQSITFNALSDKNLGDNPFDLTASASSGLTVTFTSSNTSVATVSGTTVTIVGVGSTNITASQSGNATYAPASDVVQSLTVNKMIQSVTFNTLDPKTDGDAPFNVTASASSGLDVIFSSSNTSVATVSNNQIYIVGSGTSIITATQSGNATYESASAQQTLTVNASSNLQQTFYFDFGTNGYQSGTVNGITWNDIISASTYSDLKNTSNQSSSFSLSFPSGMTFNGPTAAYGLSSPESSKLGDMALYNATIDFAYTTSTSKIKLAGLNMSKGYKFYLFGTRDATETRTTKYEAGGLNYFTEQQQTSGTNLGGTGINCNNSTFTISGIILPSLSSNATTGEIVLDITRIAGSFAYLNMMKVEEYALQTVNTTTLYVGGTSTTAGDNVASALAMNQSQERLGTASGVFEISTTLTSGGTLKFYTQNDGGGSVYGAGAVSGSIALNGSAINNAISGEVVIRVYMSNLSYQIFATNTSKISQMGSSVCYGTGSTAGNQSYMYQYGQLLSARYTANNSLTNWSMSNISVPGNNTIALLTRWDADLLRDAAKYVYYGLSLGNEGISGTGTLNDGTTGSGQQIYDQFASNMQLLVSKSRSVGKIPVLGTNNPRNTYDATTYTTYIKPMNIAMAQWDVPTVNLLGCVEDGTGKFVSGYFNDDLHPNDAGYLQMSYAVVPSLFDALKAGKTQPVLQTNTFITLGKFTSPDLLNFTPENTYRSFTSVVDINTGSTGIVETFNSSTGTGKVEITTDGYLRYTSPDGVSTITGNVIVNDNQWHKVTLTHYWAAGKMLLYTDNTLAGNTSEQLQATNFVLNNAQSPSTVKYRNWLFYRAGMNADEISALCQNKMLKSSLELYAPLADNDLTNFAQSTNTISRTINTNIISESGNSSDLFTGNPNDVLVSGAHLTVNDNRNMNSLTVEPDAKLTISESTDFSANNIVLNSSIAGTATFLDYNSTPTVNAIVKQYVTAGRNWYMSSPVAAAGYNSLNRGSYVVEWNELTKAWDTKSSGTLTPGKGYIQVASAVQGTTGIVDFRGLTNSGIFVLPVTRTESGSNRGFNLVGNPYPSYLDWSLVTADAANSAIGKTMWFRTKTSGRNYVFSTYNSTGNVAVANGAGTVITRFIPPVQAFWIQVKSGTSSTNITFKNSMRAHRDDNGNLLKAPGNDVRKRLRLQISNGSATDETLVYFDEKAQSSFDAYDSPKMFNNVASQPEIYTMSSGEKLVINGMQLPDKDFELPLGFICNTAGNFTLQATELANTGSQMQVFLHDKLENKMTELSPEAVYDFNTTSVSNNDSRFSVLFKIKDALSGVNNPAQHASVYANRNGQLVIEAGINSDYTIYNASGQVVLKGVITTSPEFTPGMENGIYLVKTEQLIQKVIIK